MPAEALATVASAGGKIGQTDILCRILVWMPKPMKEPGEKADALTTIIQVMGTIREPNIEVLLKQAQLLANGIGEPLAKTRALAVPGGVGKKDRRRCHDLDVSDASSAVGEYTN